MTCRCHPLHRCGRCDEDWPFAAMWFRIGQAMTRRVFEEWGEEIE